MTLSRMVLTVCLSAASIFAFTSSASSTEVENLSVKQMQAELALIQEVLETQHPNLGLHQSKKEFRASFSKTRKELTHSLSPQEYYRIVLPLVAQVRDGHTCIFMSEEAERKFFYFQNGFPLLLNFLHDRTVVSEESYPFPAGATVTKIDGRPIEEIVQILSNYACNDGSNSSSDLYEANKNFPTLYSLAFEEPRTDFILTFADEKGEESERRYGGETLSYAAAKYRDGSWLPKPFMWGKKLEESEAFYLRVRTFLADKGRFAATLESVFKEISDLGVEELILDLRGNPGGTIDNASLLLAYLLNKKHYFPKHIHVPKAKLQPLMDVKKRTDLNSNSKDPVAAANNVLRRIHRFGGRRKAQPQGYYVLLTQRVWGKKAYKDGLHVLIDSGTFSAASMMAAQIDLNRKATFYGEPTGGSPNRNCNAPSFFYELPHSKFRLDVAWACNIQDPNSKGDLFEPDYFFSDTKPDRRRADRLLTFVQKVIKDDWAFEKPKPKPARAPQN